MHPLPHYVSPPPPHLQAHPPGRGRIPACTSTLQSLFLAPEGAAAPLATSPAIQAHSGYHVSLSSSLARTQPIWRPAPQRPGSVSISWARGMRSYLT